MEGKEAQGIYMNSKEIHEKFSAYCYEHTVH